MDLNRNYAVARAGMIVVAALGLASTGEAQRPAARRVTPAAADKRELIDGRTTGFSLGVHTIAAPGITVAVEDEALETRFGPGVGVTAGYGFNRTFSAFASFDVAKQRTSADVEPAGTFGLVHFEVGGRANLPLGGATTVPYVSASVGRRALGARVTDEETGQSIDLSFSGKMFGLGAGIQRYFSPSLAFDGGVDLGFGKLDHLEAAGEKATIPADGSTSIRLRLGVTWRPGARRSA